MRWMDDYQLFLFDFDGLLVNTEEVHYHAYQLACEEWGVKMRWSFPEYCGMAHYRAEGLKEALEKEFPVIQERGWELFYKRKTALVNQLVNEGEVQLMPGVEKVLTLLKEANKKRCVVTHSPDLLVNSIRDKHAILNSIPFWLTRESYQKPKPDPECYIKAIEKFAKPDEKVLGFEDTPRGIKALLGTRAKPALICVAAYPEIPELKAAGVLHYSSFNSVLEQE